MPKYSEVSRSCRRWNEKCGCFCSRSMCNANALASFPSFQSCEFVQRLLALHVDHSGQWKTTVILHDTVHAVHSFMIMYGGHSTRENGNQCKRSFISNHSWGGLYMTCSEPAYVTPRSNHPCCHCLNTILFAVPSPVPPTKVFCPSESGKKYAPTATIMYTAHSKLPSR